MRPDNEMIAGNEVWRPPVSLDGLGVRLSPDQVGILVEDLESSASQFAALYGVQEWRVWRYGPDLVPSMTYAGQPAHYEMRLALSGAGPQLELIEPLRGPTIYRDWIDSHGYGLHHLGTFVDDLDTAIRAMRGAGLELIQSGAGYGLDGDGGYAYFDTVDLLGLIVELIEIPARRREPHRIWRAGRWAA